MVVRACICTYHAHLAEHRVIRGKISLDGEVIYNSPCDSEDRDEIRRAVSEARGGARYSPDWSIASVAFSARRHAQT